MSIPKEPRQLLINLMYIVLTALLALNVSAEILHAFFTMDNSLKGSNAIVATSNVQLMNAIEAQSTAYAQLEPFRAKAERAQQLSAAFIQSIDALRESLVEAAGGLDENGEPLRKSDKDITTRILVNEEKGYELQQEIQSTRNALLNLIENDTAKTELAAQLPLKVQQPSGEKDWVELNFFQMPIAAVLPLLRKFQNDAAVSEAVVLNYFLSKMGDTFYKPDAFLPVIAANQSYVIKGEEYQGEIVLAAYSTTADNIAVYVDGQPLKVENGKAIFNERPGSVGTRRHQMRIELKDPLTGDIQRFEESFSYEVGMRSASIAADKMNVMYLGVDNPITAAVAGVPTESIRLNGENVELNAVNRLGGKYLARPKRPGTARIRIEAEGFPARDFEFRVKRIPDPVMKFANKSGGEVKVAEFRAQLGIIPMLEGFDFDARCNVSGFEIARLPRSGDVIVENNQGARFRGAAKRLIDAAERGDTYFFDDIRVKCPGDTYDRKMNGMIFKVK